MPRPRLVVPRVPLHVTHRGVDRGPTFIAADDYAYYLWVLREAAVASGCAVHSYVLMTNHVHLLVTPETLTSPSRLMKSLGRRYVRFFNDRYRRTGTLWEGRFRSTIVDSARYYFTCARYIELNPVRAGLAESPAQYPWSSFRHNALGQADSLVTPHAEYDALGCDQVARCAAYRKLFDDELETVDVVKVRAEIRGRPTLYPTAYQQLAAAMVGAAALRQRRLGEDSERPSL
jgi:putative transposase